ncbi:MAG: class I SAM-dependent methyltransferase [Myxococcota bacterium]
MEDHTPAACPLCSTSGPPLLYRLSLFSIYRCARCDFVYLWPVPDPDEIRLLFSDLYAGGSGTLPELRGYYDFCYDDSPSNPLVQLYDGWLAELEKQRGPGRLLDVGCGTGLSMSVARGRGWSPFGVDECSEALAHARDQFGLEVRQGEFSGFQSEGQRYDGITMWDIIEHTRQPVELLRAARECLSPDGVLAVSTPNQRSILDAVAGGFYRLSGGRIRTPLEKFYIEQHFVYFSPKTLEDALSRAGLRLVLLRRELTDLRRLTLSPPMRLVLQGLFLGARLTGLQNRLFALARRA